MIKKLKIREKALITLNQDHHVQQNFFDLVLSEFLILNEEQVMTAMQKKKVIIRFILVDSSVNDINQ
jgi:hypothetical protein